MGKEKHFIKRNAGVHCVMRGKEVDIEVCLGCARLENYDFDSRQPYLICEGPEDHVLRVPSLEPRTAT